MTPTCTNTGQTRHKNDKGMSASAALLHCVKHREITCHTACHITVSVDCGPEQLPKGT